MSPINFEDIFVYKKKIVAQRQVTAPLESLRALAKLQDRPKDVATVLRVGKAALFSHVINPNSSLGQATSGTASYDPVGLARRLVGRGAQGLIVSTDMRFDGGGVEHLPLVANAVRVPVVRHDYIIDEYQVVETRAAGGDGLTLYPALLSQERLRSLISATQRNLMTVIAVVHSETELEAVLPHEPRVIAINNHDPATDQIDLSLTGRLLEHVPGHINVLTMGGFESPWDLVQVAAGVDGVVVRQSMLLIPTLATTLRELLGIDPPQEAPSNGSHLTTTSFF